MLVFGSGIAINHRIIWGSLPLIFRADYSPVGSTCVCEYGLLFCLHIKAEEQNSKFRTVSLANHTIVTVRNMDTVESLMFSQQN